MRLWWWPTMLGGWFVNIAAIRFWGYCDGPNCCFNKLQTCFPFLTFLAGMINSFCLSGVCHPAHAKRSVVIHSWWVHDLLWGQGGRLVPLPKIRYNEVIYLSLREILKCDVCPPELQIHYMTNSVIFQKPVVLTASIQYLWVTYSKYNFMPSSK